MFIIGIHVYDSNINLKQRQLWHVHLKRFVYLPIDSPSSQNISPSATPPSVSSLSRYTLIVKGFLRLK